MSCGLWPAPRRGCEAVCFLELPADPAAVRWARCQVKVAARAWQLPEGTIDTLELAVSELVTNAIRASGPGHLPLAGPGAEAADVIRLTLRHRPGRLVIEVFDASPDPPVLADADPEAESGRGLILVQALSKEWSFFLLPSGGKVTYCVVDA